MKRLDSAELPCESQISVAILLICSLMNGEENVILDASNIFFVIFTVPQYSCHFMIIMFLMDYPWKF